MTHPAAVDKATTTAAAAAASAPTVEGVVQVRTGLEVNKRSVRGRGRRRRLKVYSEQR